MKLNDDDIKLLRLLVAGPKTAAALSATVPVGVVLHLERLRMAGAVRTYPIGLAVGYSITDEGLAKLKRGAK